MSSRPPLAIVALSGGLLVSCLMAGGPCPCGESFERDPFGSDASIGIGLDHEESVHCFCRCGDGPRERLAPSETCAAYEGPCQARNGEIAPYRCE